MAKKKTKKKAKRAYRSIFNELERNARSQLGALIDAYAYEYKMEQSTVVELFVVCMLRINLDIGGANYVNALSKRLENLTDDEKLADILKSTQ